MVKEIRSEDGRRGFERQGIIKVGSIGAAITLLLGGIGGFTIKIVPDSLSAPQALERELETAKTLAAENRERSLANDARLRYVEASIQGLENKLETNRQQSREDFKEVRAQLTEILKRLPAGG